MDPFQDPEENNAINSRGGESGVVANKRQRDGLVKDVEIAIKRFKATLKGDDLSIRAYKFIIEESIVIIEQQQKLKLTALKPFQNVNPPNSKANHTVENPIMNKILQEVQTIKATISHTQGLPRTQG